jgi:hypothetical protein
MFSKNLETAPRTLNRPEFHNPALVRKGDLWHNPSQNYHKKLTVNTVTKYTSPEYESIWYVITFSDNTEGDPTGLNIGEGMGMGTFYQGNL